MLSVYTKLTLLVVLVFLFSISGGQANGASGSYQIQVSEVNEVPVAPGLQTAGMKTIYLPLVRRPSSGNLRINASYFNGDVNFSETSIFWFGRVTNTENYADVRVGYNQSELYVHVTIFDHYLWYDRSASVNNMTAWDAVTLYLNKEGNQGGQPGGSAYRLVSQLSWTEAREKYQAAYQGNGSGWNAVSLPYTTAINWRGNAPNEDSKGDRGWMITYHIPFSSLGMSGPPAEGAAWGLGVAVHDRDNAAGTLIPDQTWPLALQGSRPSSWGQIGFGLPAYNKPSLPVAGTTTIRNKLDGATVVDGEVGGGNTCGLNVDFWNEWGDRVNPGGENNTDLNIQNQFDVGDWPCFSKTYVTFPLNSVPAGQSILSATLTLYHFANAGGGQWGASSPSLIQVATAAGDWSESSLSWNNAPLVLENISRTWVNPLQSAPAWPGVPYTWDVSRAVAKAIAAGEPLRLVLYSTDGAYDSGKYFVSSDAQDWNKKGRPTLDIAWGNP